MSLNRPPRPQHSAADDELRKILDEAESRKVADLQRRSRKLSWILGVPTVAVLVWGAGFLLQYRANDQSVAIDPAPLSRVATPSGLADFDDFRPESLRTRKPAAPVAAAPKEFKMVDQEDIRFAMELLNYVQSPATKDEKKP